jgi:hypothetical protein
MCDVIADVFGLGVDDVLTVAGHRPTEPGLDPNDPRNQIISLVRRVRMTPDRVRGLVSILEGWRDDDRKAGKEG